MVHFAGRNTKSMREMISNLAGIRSFKGFETIRWRKVRK